MKKSTAVAVDEILELFRVPFEKDKDSEFNLVPVFAKPIQATNKPPLKGSIMDEWTIPLIFGDPLDAVSEILSELRYRECYRE